jgi:hypothetical protein
VIAELHRDLNQRLRVQEWLPMGMAAVSVKGFISEAKRGNYNFVSGDAITYSCNAQHGGPCFHSTIPTAIIFDWHDRVREIFSEIIVVRVCDVNNWLRVFRDGRICLPAPPRLDL